MPSVDDNLSIWGGRYEWPEGGDEWSQAWGGEDAQWFGTILPRVQAFVTDRDGAARDQVILEIAPGHGRWTKYLKELCRRLIVVDLAPSCIEACRRRFATERHIEYLVNDGRSLADVPDGAIDFVFSMDSLVHAEVAAVDAYLAQLAAKRTPNGVAFLHHSNLGAVAATVAAEPDHGRARSVTGDGVRARAEASGLRCLSQERINWGGPHLIDALTTLVRAEASWPSTSVIRDNPEFMAEAAACAERAALYGKRRFVP
jgi:SAM-dependent methyltransferase